MLLLIKARCHILLRLAKMDIGNIRQDLRKCLFHDRYSALAAVDRNDIACL